MQIFNDGDYMRAVEAEDLDPRRSPKCCTRRIIAGGQGTAAAAGVFPGRLRPARHRAASIEGRTHARRSTVLPDRVAIQMNDTHPALAVAELMRILVDEARHGLGRGLGDHARRVSATPTTRCCPRRWRSGRWRCWSMCCRATCRSSTRSTGVSWTQVGAALSRATPAACAACRSSRKGGRSRCAWRIWRSSAATRSTACRRCTAELVEDAARSATSISSGRSKFNNKTNGVTPRRWLLKANPGLAALITETHRRRLDHRLGQAARAGAARRRRRLPAASFAGSSRPTRVGLATVHPRHDCGVTVDPDFAVRRAGQAHPRVQAAAAERPAHHPRVSAA